MFNPYYTVNESGVFTVDTSEIQSAVEEAYKQALGDTLNVNDGVQKQLIMKDVETITQAMNDAVMLLNNNNIFYATGEALDITASRFGYYRQIDVPTVVNATLGGTEGTVIPRGSICLSGDNEYKLLESVQIGVGGTVSAEFQCLESGAVVCLAGTLNTIKPSSAINGWDTVTNAQAGITGYERESDNTFRNRCLNTLLQMRSKTLLGAIGANVGQVDNVMSVKVLENPYNATNVVEGVTMTPYSIFVGVLGGDGAEIAEVLAKEKTLGCPMVGNTVVTYYDPTVQYNNNYNITRPTFTDIDIEVSYKAIGTTPANIQDLIVEQVMSYLADNPFQIGQTVSSFYINQAFDNFNYAQIFTTKIKLHTDALFGDFAVINADEIAVLDEANISFEVL